MTTIGLQPYQTAKGIQYSRPLGTASTVAAGANVINAGVTVVNTSTSGDYGIDPAAKKVLAVNSAIATTALTIAAAAQAAPVVGQIIGAVAAIIAGIATIIGKNKAKVDALRAQRMQIEQINAVLIQQNAELDTEIAKLKVAIDKMASALSIKLNGLSGCLFNCKKKEAEKLLSNAQTLNAELNKEQLERAELVLSLAKIAESMVTQKSNRKLALGISIALVAIGTFIFINRK